MRRLSRSLTLFAGFCLSGASPASLAQEQPLASDTALAFEVPELTELRIARSSRTDVPDTITVETSEIPAEPTRILDPKGAERLMRNEGVTLQWIGWEKRGPAWVAVTTSGHWSLLGGQDDPDLGRLELEGFITEIGKDYFVFEGTIKMRGAPGAERLCNATKSWRFAVTQNRSYYRLREFEWCDGLTDYIDIYFDPALR